jgi:triosephosphate isomerase (TIM)
MAPRPVIAGNWKMFGSRAMADAYAAGLKQKLASARPRGDLVICPPASLIGDLARALAGSGVGIGGQDCHSEATGAHTGDIAAPMIADAGGGWVIVGHSERRAAHGESDSQVAAKAAAAHAAGLIAIICIGESAAEREKGEAQAVVARQIAGSVPSGAGAANSVVAYEPIWAIGSGVTPTASDIADMHRHIRACVRKNMTDPDGVRLLYGGSVKRANARQILATAEVNGVLVGGASLELEEFWAIAEACP